MNRAFARGRMVIVSANAVRGQTRTGRGKSLMDIGSALVAGDQAIGLTATNSRMNSTRTLRLP
jgi:hypothetical protein